VGKAGEKRQLGRPKPDWEDNASYSNGSYRNVREILDWIHLAQDKEKWPVVVNENKPPFPKIKAAKLWNI
jgi:hypothetical protein